VVEIDNSDFPSNCGHLSQGQTEESASRFDGIEKSLWFKAFLLKKRL
jgi:hypothetical protein